MHRITYSVLLILSALSVILSACAKISSPSGGPRDKIPPVVLECVPENGAINFQGKLISITFDEYVQLDNINEKFMVSPPLEKRPRIFKKGKSVNVEFEEELKDSTTYTFYFQDAIRDLNEGNIIENYQFVFSTGPVIDSLSVTGNVYNAFTLEIPEKAMVLLYSNLEDTAVLKNIPDYISRVDNTGYFRFDNVKSGKYKLYALKDADNSKNFNMIDEEFAFFTSPVDISSDKNYLPVEIDTTTLKKEPAVTTTLPAKATPLPAMKGEYQLILFKSKKKNHYLAESERENKYHMFYTLSLPPDSMKFEFSIPGFSSDSYLSEMSRQRDTLNIWLIDSMLYSQQLITSILNYPFTDTLGIIAYKEDTVQLRFIEPRAPRVAKIAKPVFKVDINLRSGALKPGQQIVINSGTPLREPDESRIWLYEVADTVKKEVPYSFVKDSTNSLRYVMKSELLPGKKYLYIADSAAYGNIYGENTDSTGISFSIKEKDAYNQISFTLKYEGNLIIQLLTQDERLVSQKKLNNGGTVVFDLLEKGIYRARAIYDLNGDGEWTTGDFTLGRQPEPVSYYQKEIDLSPGFFIENTDWNLESLNVKDQKLKTKIQVSR